MSLNPQATDIAYRMEQAKAAWHRAQKQLEDNLRKTEELKKQYQQNLASESNLRVELVRIKEELDRRIAAYLHAGTNWCKLEAVDPNPPSKNPEDDIPL